MTKLVTRIHCIDLMGQLGKETVVSYEADNETISGIVDDLLALQVLTPPVTKGTIDTAIGSLTRSIKVEGITILNTILKLRETTGGFVEVDNDRKFNWRVSIGEDKGQQIRCGKNLKGIERVISYPPLANRIYAYGQGEGDARIKLSQAEGQTEDYVEDTNSQKPVSEGGWGGIYVKVFVDKTITSPETLLAWANQLLAAYKNPPIIYRIDTLDLSKRTDKNFSFEKLQLGSVVTVISEKLGINDKTNVVKIRHPDLNGKPGYMQVELSTKSRDIGDLLANVYDTQQLSQRSAVQIGAGQVSVLGTFKVSDWLNAGETTICGDNIRSGVLQSNNWGENAGSYFDLVGGTFKLGGSSDPALKWDGETLTITGMGGYLEAGEAAADVNSHATTISGNKISTGALQSTNWGLGAGSYFDLNAGTFKLGGSSAPKLSWDGTTLKMTSTLQTTNIETGKTLTVNGAISAGGGKITLDATELTLRGNALSLRDQYGTIRGNLYGIYEAVILSSASNIPIQLLTGSDANITLQTYNTNKIILDSGSVRIPRRSSHPSNPVVGDMYYNTTDNHLYLYRGSWVAID